MNATTDLIVIGDSYGKGINCETNTTKDGWTQILGVPDANNFAIPGSTSLQWATDNDGGLTSAVARARDKTVVVSLGGNDAINDAHDDDGGEAITPEEVFQNLKNIDFVIKRMIGVAKRVVVFEYPDPYCGIRPYVHHSVLFMDGGIRTIAWFSGCKTLMLQTILNRFDCFNGLDIHPNKKGHEIIALTLTALISQLEDDKPVHEALGEAMHARDLLAVKGEPKQVIVMRKDLHMRRGKQIAQGSHASMKVIFDMGSFDRGYPHHGNDEYFVILDMPAPMIEWLKGRFTKICVYVNSEEELIAVFQKAKDAGLPTALITDAGLTEFKGVPTRTCCAIGPANAEDVNKITGELPLL